MRLLSVTAGRRLRAELAVLTHAGGQVLKGGASRALQRFPEVLSRKRTQRVATNSHELDTNGLTADFADGADGFGKEVRSWKLVAEI